MSNVPGTNPLSNADKYKTIVSYLVTIVVAPFASKYISDAATQQTFLSGITALIVALITIAPVIYDTWRKPSSAAMAVAKQADAVMSGDAPTSVTVATGPGKPDITVKAS